MCLYTCDAGYLAFPKCVREGGEGAPAIEAASPPRPSPLPSPPLQTPSPPLLSLAHRCVTPLVLAWDNMGGWVAAGFFLGLGALSLVPTCLSAKSLRSTSAWIPDAEVGGGVSEEADHVSAEGAAGR